MSALGGRPLGRSFQKAKPVQPKWHAELIVLCAAACWVRDTSDEAVALRNGLRRQKSFGNLVSYDVRVSGQYVNGAKWVARDPQWSKAV